MNSNESQLKPAVNRVSNGLLDSDKQMPFIFNDRKYYGLPGDTLASALLANGQRLIGRSFKYHRPRGIITTGSEEPNALVELGVGAYKEPNTRATTIELFANLEAKSQNHIGPLSFDIMAINDRLSSFLTAGFYYKTFMWPKSFWEKIYEPIIRAAAGLGALSGEEDPDSYDKGFLHCDLLVIGAGAAGLSAALTAGRAGLKIIIADEDFLPGGRLNLENIRVDDLPSALWAANAHSELKGMSNVRFMTRTTVYGAYDHGIYGALEKKTDHKTGISDGPRQILWRIYSKQAILAAGATERSIAFGDNDRPGIMLAGAVRGYLNRFGVTPGKKVAVFTNNDSGWQTAKDLEDANVEVTAVVDTRNIDAPLRLKGAQIAMNSQVVGTRGRLGLQSIELSDGQMVDCDCLAVSGGWNPNVHLTCHQRGRPIWKSDIAAFIPGQDLPVGMSVIGSASGAFGLGEALRSGHDAACNALASNGIRAAGAAPAATDDHYSISPYWQVPNCKGKSWVDHQNDVTTKDISLSVQEGFKAVEHLKRYTTLGMATDQGKTANVLGLGVLSELTGQSIQETGTTIFRPPYTCLLYTSPSPRDKRQSRMPSSA